MGTDLLYVKEIQYTTFHITQKVNFQHNITQEFFQIKEYI